MTADLRQRIAEAIRPVQWQTYTADDGYPASAPGTPEEIADAVLVVLQQHLGPTAADHYRARWESTVVEARRQAARADALEQQAAGSAWNTMRLGEDRNRLRNENAQLRAELDDLHGRLNDIEALCDHAESTALAPWPAPHPVPRWATDARAICRRAPATVSAPTT